MTDLRRLLNQDDPLAGDGGPTDAELREMRRQIVAAAAERRVGLRVSTLLLAAIPALLLIALGAGLHRAHTRVEDTVLPPAEFITSDAPVRRLYFQTAGGTRVFWTFTAEGSGEQK